MTKFIMLVGLPGCGKSTLAKQLAEVENAEVFSSDAYRLKLFGDENSQQNNNLVFDTLYTDLTTTLISGKSVILDATNINYKSRAKALSRIVGIDCYKIAIVLPVPLDVCVAQDACRNRTVDKSVIEKFISKFEYPQKFEGFDEVVIFDAYTDFKEDFYSSNDRRVLMYSMSNFDQKNHWHKYSLGDHCAKVASHFKDDMIRQEAGYFHDVGKMYTQVFDETGEAYYYSHANWSAYYMLVNRYILKKHKQYEFNEIMFYINQHMHIRDIIKSNKAIDRYKKLWGEERYLKLLDFMYADNASSGTNRYMEKVEK